MAGGDPFRRFGILPNQRSQGDLEIMLRCTARFVRLLRGEIGSPYPVPWRARLAALRRGFTATAATLYRLDETDLRDYVPDLAFAYHGYKINGFLNPIVGNKRVLAQVLAAYDVPHARLLAMVVAGRLVDAEGRLDATSAGALERLAAESATLVLRPDWSGGGEGVFFVRRTADGWSVNGVAASLDDVCSLIASLDRYVVNAFVEQAGYARDIFPATANTVRVLTLWDPDTGPFVAGVVHRFGTSRSMPIDNWHQGRGGLCAAVDAETALLGRAATLDTRFRLDWQTSHPETGGPITGVTIPHLAETLGGIVRAARCFPGALCVGWDVLVTDDGFRILEANSPPGLFVWQVHAPLLADARVARFFARFGLGAGAPRRRGHA
jgi:hypothetical protein